MDFLAATLSAEIGSTDGIVKVIGDCVEMGIPVLPPDINESRQKFAAVGPAIRFGLAAVKGVGEAAAAAILQERLQGAVPLLHGLRRSTRPAPRQQAHARRAHLRRSVRLPREEPRDAGRGLRAGRRPGGPDARRRGDRAERTSSAGAQRSPCLAGEDFLDLPEWSVEERLKGEKEVLGFYVTGHPLTRFAEAIERFADAKISELPSLADKTVRVGGVLVGLKKQKIKKGMNEGKTMLKAVLEDMTGSVPVAIFASLYEKVDSWVRTDLPVLVTGTVRESGPACELTVQEITPLEGISERLARSLQIRVNLAFADERVLARLKDRLKSHPGTTPVSIRLFRPGEFEATLKAADSMRIALSPVLTSEIRALAGEDSVEYVFE